ncbi:adhesion G-protein coupled receptor G2 [Limanda limanda]|uniref:adhesion G-protein coupled receptor G2 n=1 Tax=Limanda limanda TaxID=27771 RepID=UPI0029C8BA69|nr:adhesion G-protein coupled receptor G2 [Limanda limanda]
MSGSVDGCSLSKVVQRIIDSNSSIANDKPLTRMVLCGSPGSTVLTLLASNLTWVSSDQPNSAVCQPNSTLVQCEVKETLAVRLTDSCPPEPSTTTHGISPTTTGTPESSTPSITNNNQQTNATTDFTTAAQQTNATQGIAQPDTTTSPTTSSATNSTAGPGTTMSQEAKEELANRILEQTQDASQLDSSQVDTVADQLERLLDGPSVSRSVGQKVVNIVSNLMEGDAGALSGSANRLIRVVDTVGLKLAVSGDRGILSAQSLVLAVRTVDGTNFPTTSVDIFNTDNVQLRGLGRTRSKRSASALGSVFLPSTLTAGLSPEQQQQASRVQFTFYTKNTFFQDPSLENTTVVSPVLASSVANLSISNLSEDIQFTIQNTNPATGNFTASCVFWDFTQNAGDGGWSSDGCFVVNATSEKTICSCNHLTSFAILLDLSREGIIDREHAQILTFITYIGCGVSAIFLAVTLLTYLSFDKLMRDIPAKILVQLSFSLLFLNLVFLLDGWLALYPAVGLCISTAFFLHYFLLTTFTWAGLEALHMYLSIVRVFTPYLSKYMLKFSLIGWGVPLIVVIIIIAVDKDNYGLVTYGKYTDGTSDDFCWLRNDIAFYVGVVAYFLAIFAVCLVVFIVVMIQLTRIKKQNPQNQAPNRGVMTDVRSVSGLIILLGLTWGFALFAWGPLYLPFVYLFTIFNSLQGFFVFVFHCAIKENVRRQWRTYLCCGRLRLAENSDWSRTATQNHRNLSMATAFTSAPDLSSQRSSVVSDITNSSGSVFVDSGISDGTNSDVVFNDLHRRNTFSQGVV